jgi:hypothetical protein
MIQGILQSNFIRITSQSSEKSKRVTPKDEMKVERIIGKSMRRRKRWTKKRLHQL